MKHVQKNSVLISWTAVCFTGGLIGSFIGGILSRLI